MTYPICFNRFIIVATQGPPSDPRQVADSSHQGRKKYPLKLLQAHFSLGEMRGLSPPKPKNEPFAQFQPFQPFQTVGSKVGQSRREAFQQFQPFNRGVCPELLSKGSVQTG
jgi:hypothetical protein